MKTIEIESEVNVWKCDVCNAERNVRKDEINSFGAPPIGWYRLRRNDTNVNIEEALDFCSLVCLVGWAKKKHEAAVPA